MLKELPSQEETPPELRELVKVSVQMLGFVIEQSVGKKTYETIENIRKTMSDLRAKEDVETLAVLRSTFAQMKKMKPAERQVVAGAFTLMLELMNTCENAYRSHRLAEHAKKNWQEATAQKAHDENDKGAEAIIYVLTAHPTEARAPSNIAVFHLIQSQLIDSLDKRKPPHEIQEELRHLLELAWRTPIVRERSPAVEDEAEHIYSTLLAKDTIDSLLEVSHEIVPVYIRSWVGGDKDGHPGVNEKVFHNSLSLSRTHIVNYMQAHLGEISLTLQTLGLKAIQSEVASLSRTLEKFRTVRKGDGSRATALRKNLQRLMTKYKKEYGVLHPGLAQLRRLMHVFPGFVVPLELRESSDVLLSDTSKKSTLAIDRMLRMLASLSSGGNPRWYARGFIISMASTLEHLQVADQKIRNAFGKSKLPVIPLFEQAEALKNSPEIIQQWIGDPRLGKDIRDEWGGHCEMMVGYSDSSKESGVLYSRLEIATAMHRLDEVCQRENVQPIFFQGSGGSIDRGGGSVQDQTAWWPHSAIRHHKVTIQGEMVERSLASPEIIRGQIERIAESAVESLRQPSRAPQLENIRSFVDSAANSYREMIKDTDFLQIVAKATPYSDLGELRIGSRPVARAVQLSVQGLRAIPWVFCWTQTRVLFPTWWGVGSSWRNADKKMRGELRETFAREPVFASYVRALGFTLAKVELGVWRIYLDNSGLDPALTDRFYSLFQKEFLDALEMVRFISGDPDPLWFRHWLGASIRLRSPMIHPLNLLQILAIRDRDFVLLRTTVTGISSGMLTTG